MKNKTVSKMSEPLVTVTEVLSKGQQLYGDSRLKTEALFPCWMDLKLVRIGQAFARRNLAQLGSAHFLGLVLLLTNPQIRRALYSTGKSETPLKAYERYMATAMQVILWYREDVLSPNWLLSVTTVRVIHDTAGRSYEEKNLTRTFSQPLLTREHKPQQVKINEFMWNAFDRDLESARRNKLVQKEGIEHSDLHQPKHLFNQYLMSLTQWAFVSLPLILPTRVGIVKWTDLELKGFAHLWAVICFVLGMEEQFIMCRDPQDLSGCKKYLHDMLHTHMVPNMYNMDFEGKVMMEALLKSTNFAVPGTPIDYFLIKILEDIAEIPASNLNRRSDWRAHFGRYLSKNWAVPLNHNPFVNKIVNTTAFWSLRWNSILAFGDSGTNSSIVAREFYVF